MKPNASNESFAKCKREPPERQTRGCATAVKTLPFSVNKNLAVNLSDQLADGLRSAILSGYFKKGEMLPKLSDMAEALGVSIDHFVDRHVGTDDHRLARHQT